MNFGGVDTHRYALGVDDLILGVVLVVNVVVL